MLLSCLSHADLLAGGGHSGEVYFMGGRVAMTVEIPTSKTPPLLCVSTVFVAKTLPLRCVFPLPSRLRHCLCLACSTAFVAKTLPLPCVCTAAAANDSAFALCEHRCLHRRGPRLALREADQRDVIPDGCVVTICCSIAQL